ncbi:MAG: hypothetical protein RMJ28_05345 [Nitrososphaerota archaeon]|nr:hypothetical protein [Candidatus Calditenuaceae archaeon]MDW8073641.1 hypothetical protein [Nitrososphaerota archaeon]
MACFITPLVAAIVLSVAGWVSPRLRERFSLLRILMWGGAVGLVADHVVNGELVPYPPFLTGWNPASGLAPLLEELLFIGGPITLSITGLWGFMLVAPRLFSLPTLSRVRALLKGG